jgi:hypothetical protein
MYPFSTAFGFLGGVVGNIPNFERLYVISMFVYVPPNTGHKISVKGTLGVGGLREEGRNG